MIYQNPQSFTSNLNNDNIFPSHSLMLNPNYNIKNKYYMETPQLMKSRNNYNNNNLNIYNDFYIENSFNKDINYKGISNSIKAELKQSSNNLVNLTNSPSFEKICLKIFFPKDDPFHLSSSKKSPNKKEIKNNNNNINSPLLLKEKEKENIINMININNNTDYNQNTKRKEKSNLSFSQTKKSIIKNSNSFSTSKSSKSGKSSDKKSNINNNRLPIKRNVKYINELKSLIKNEKIHFCNNICSSISTKSTKAKSSTNIEIKIKNTGLVKNKNKNKRIKKEKKINLRYTKRAKKYKNLTEEIKKKLLADAKNMRTIDVAKKYGISTRNINRWKKLGIKRKRGSGRKFKDPDLENKILIWYNFQDKKNITAKTFKKKALELSNNSSFRASSGWLTLMKRKYHIKFKKN